jgi:hypothetical protein
LKQLRFSSACFAALEPSKDYNPWQAADTKITKKSQGHQASFVPNFVQWRSQKKNLRFAVIGSSA